MMACEQRVMCGSADLLTQLIYVVLMLCSLFLLFLTFEVYRFRKTSNQPLRITLQYLSIVGFAVSKQD